MMKRSTTIQSTPLSGRSTSSLLVTFVAVLFAAIVLLLVAVQRTDAQVEGGAWAWGQNVYGQLGDGTTTQRNAPVQVRGFSDEQAIIDGGYRHSLALKSDGTVWAWGRNKFGQLGAAGTITQRNAPVQVRGISGVQAVDAGGNHNLAIR